MRYEDASHTDSFQGSSPIANDDADTLTAGARAPATGNVITGEGTQYGAAGADSAAGAHITAIAGSGGEDSSFAGGKLGVSGQFGSLSMDANGNYSYVAHKDAPENVRDRFTYTLADNQGGTDTAALIVEIGKTPVVIKANATQIVPGPDGVVTLPPGVELSDVMVVGRNLVVNMPDGTQLIIVDGAVFVPQLVLGGVEVPATNVAALLIGQEPQPAAGELPPSSGGNFAVPPPPLDPGVPLGDLIPPTEYTYVPPEPQEVFDIIDREPTIVIQPDGQPAAVNAIDSVDEKGLPGRDGNLPDEPEGSGEEAAAGANGDPSEATAGTIIIDSPDGVDSVTINGVLVTGAIGQQIAGAFGTLTITGFSGQNILYSYLLNDNTSGNNTHDDFSVTLTDDDGDQATATLVIDIIDDVPTARPDTDSIASGQYGPVTGNVITDASAGDAGDSDSGVDTVGADDAHISAVSSANVPANVDTDAGANFLIAGQYGVLTLNTDGSYSYTRNAGTPGGVNDVFNYTLTDGDGDTSTTTLTISIVDATPQTGPNPTAQLDDDTQPGGIAGGVGDDVDAANLTGNLAASGGDGPLTYAYQLSGAPAGFTYVAGPGGSVLVQQGGVTVLTVTLNSATGAYTVTQNAPIDHAAGGDENNQPFTINYTVTDQDGDSASGTLGIDVDDDTPSIGRSGISLPTLTVDETILANNDSADYSVVFAGNYGADGPGTTSYAVTVVNGTDSGLDDVATGQSILLYNIGGQVVGSTSATLGGVNAGNTAFTVSVNSGTGVVTLDQLRAVSHPDASNPDDPVSPTGTSIQLVATITDGDGDPASLSVNIGGSLVFRDDGPTIDVTVNGGVTEPVLLTQDTETDGTPTTQDSASSSANFGGAFGLSFTTGADGAPTPTLSYSLGMVAGASGLTQGGVAINLYLIGGVVVGSTSATQGGVNAGNTVFDVSVNGSGVVTLTQYSQIDHPLGGDPTPSGTPFADHIISLVDSKVTLTASSTITDNDGDQATDSATINIGANLQFADDGPDISAVLTGTQIRIDETDGVAAVGGEVDPVGGNLGTVTVSAASLFTVSNVNVSADTPTTLGYGLVLSSQGVASGLLLSTTNAPIFLYSIGGVITGSTSATLGGVNAGNTAFTVSIDAGSGAVTMTQFLAVEHFNTSSNDEDSSGLTAGVLQVQVTATDFDGDTDQANVDLGSVIRFEDDGPTIDVSVSTQNPEPILVTQDSETDGVPTAQDSASSSANFGGLFNLSFTTGSDGAASPVLGYALGVSSQGVDSGLDSSGASIFLYNIGGVVVGSTSATQGGVNAGNTVFDVTVSGTGVVTLTQYAQIDHTSVDPSPTGAPFTDHVASLVDSLVTLTASSTITDNDGDQATDSATINIGANLQFQDDGPDISAVLTGNQIRIDETDGVTAAGGEVDPVGGNLGTVTVSAATLFSVSNVNVSADTPTTLGYSLALSAPGVDSGLDVSSNNASIFLYNISGTVVGSTSATLGGVNAGNTAFTVSINSSTGAVTLTQFLAIEHSNTGSNDEDSSPFNANVLQVQVTATDFDGDTDVASVDLGSVIRFEDDGPSAQPDVDTIVGGNGPATGNLITGIDIGGGDANATDGVADSVGSDTPGSITAIASVNVPANVDTDPSANFTIAGQYGTLTLNANGDYSYIRTSAAGGVQDVFTYTLTDADGDSVQSTLTISIEDKFPIAGNVNVVVDDDDVNVAGNAGGPDDDAPSNVSGNLPGSGGDGALTFGVLLTGAPAGFTYVSGGAGVVLVKQGATTVLTITVNSATGAYSVVENNPIMHPTLNGGPGDDTENNVSFTVNYTVTDADGDSAPGTINISVDDDTPTINVTKGSDSGVNLTTDDLDSIGAGTDTASTSANFGGVFGLTQSVGADGGAAATLSYALNVSAPGVDSGLDQGGANIFLYLIGGKVVGSTSATSGGVNAGNTVFDVGVTSPGGVVTLTQYSQIDHPIGGDPSATGAPFADHILSMTDSLITLTASSTITDNDGDTATDSEVVNIGANLHFTDDGPDVAAVLTGTQIRIDETDGVVAAGGEVDPVGGNLGTVTMTLASLVTVTNPHVSADSPTTNSYALVLSSQGVASGLLQSAANAPIFLYDMGGGVIAGSTSATLGGVNAGNTAFQFSINSGTGAVTLTQFLAVEHSNTASNDEDSTGLTAGVLKLQVTATDFDGDTDSAQVDLGSVVRFEDDGPTLGTIQAGTANNNPAAAHSFGSLHFAVGSDSPGDVTNITTGSLAGITSGGKALVTNFDNASNVLTAYQDANGNGLYDALTDTTAVFTLTVNPTGGPGGGTWDFDLITPLDPTVVDTPIGGSSSFGAGPTLGQQLQDAGGTTTLSVVSGYHPTGSFNPTTWMSTGTLPAAAVTAAGVNGSTSGWGVDNNNFENTDEIMFFDFGDEAQADPDGGGAYTPPAGSLPEITFARFEFIHYSSGAGDAGDDIAYVVHYVTAAGAAAGFASGFVPDANIDGAIWTVSAPAGLFIADVQFFSGREPSGAVQDLASGKVDLVSVGVTTSSINKDISFNITMTDADGDPVTGGFTMNIANANSPSVATAPLVLDLNGDGVQFLAHDAGVHYDYGSGSVATAWAGPNDGILVHDANGNGTVDGAGEFVFGHDGLTDMQALAAQYGSALNANDADYAKFGVWQDANSNGAVDAGEYQTLAAAGIVSINLVSDGVSYSAAGGDVDVAGSSSFTRADGSSGIVADAAFWTGGRAASDEQRALTGSTSNIALAAAVAAAGLAHSYAAAANPAFSEMTFDSSVHQTFQTVNLNGDGRAAFEDSVSRLSLGNESIEPAFNAVSPSSSIHSFNDNSFVSHGLEATSFGNAAPAYVPQFAANEAVASSGTAFAMPPSIGMPSAAMLEAVGSLQGNVQHGSGSIEAIVSDALGQGNAPATVDALLNAFHGGGAGELGAIANLASPAASGVPGWDMTMHGAFGTGFDMMMKMGAEMLHHDAVQPVQNG